MRVVSDVCCPLELLSRITLQNSQRTKWINEIILNAPSLKILYEERLSDDGMFRCELTDMQMIVYWDRSVLDNNIDIWT